MKEATEDVSVRVTLTRSKKRNMKSPYSIEFNSPEMDKLLCEFAEPFLSVSKTDEEKRFVVQTAILAWNTNLLASSEAYSLGLGQLLRGRDLFGEEKKFGQRIIKEPWLALTEKKRREHAENRQFILDSDLEMVGDEIKLNLVTVEVPLDWTGDEILQLSLDYDETMNAYKLEEY